jgi:hypothetical protein
MDITTIVHELDAEIARLTSARDILIGSKSTKANQREKTPKSSLGKVTVKTKSAHRLSPAGRKKLSELMKKRWAERRKKAGAKAK